MKKVILDKSHSEKSHLEITFWNKNLLEKASFKQSIVEQKSYCHVCLAKASIYLVETHTIVYPDVFLFMKI
jgi:hypothetical protein